MHTDIHRDPVPRYFSRSRIAAALFLLLLFSASIIGYNIHRVNRGMADRLSHALQLAERTLPPAIWQFNYDYLNDFTAALFLENRVVYVSILTDGVPVVARTRPRFKDRSFAFFKDDPSLFETGAADILYEGRRVALIQMAFSREGIYVGMVANVIGAILLMAAGFGGVMRYYSRLKESEQRYRTLYNNSVEGLFQTSAEGRFIRVNPSLARMLGFGSPQEMIDSVTDIEKQIYVYPEQRQQIMDRLNRGDRVAGFETQARRKDGGRIWVSLSVRAERDAAGNILYFDGLMMDITERKARERAEQERQAAEASARAKSEFLANMSHEIRTPMNAVMGLADLTLKTPLNRQQAGYLKKIRASANTLLGILNDILDFSKIEAGKLDMEVLPFDLPELLENLRALFSDKAAGKSLAMGLEKGEGVPDRIMGDPLRLNQILMNLVGNAVKFTEQGRVDIAVAVAAQTPEEIRLRFSVTDTGIGIESSLMEKLFDSFTQADGSTTRKYGGTGLGLAISRRLADLMGGALRAESEPGRGSTFQCILPFGRVSAAAAAIESFDAAASGPPLHLRGAAILLVEDNPINQEVALEILKGVGLSVTVAENGRAAVAAVRQKGFDAILMDVQMPVMDGYEATRRIKAMSREIPGALAGPNPPPVIAMTAHAMKGDRERCFAAGMDDYITKPIDIHQLFTILSRWIERPAEPKTASSGTLSSPEDAGPAVPSADPVLPEIPGAIDMEEAVGRLSGRKDLFLRLFTRFCREYGDMGERIGHALGEGERERAYQLAHEVKGVAGNLSANALFSVAGRLEKAIRTGEEDPKPLLKEFHEALAHVTLLGCRMEAETVEPFPQAPLPDQADAEKQLDELGRLLSKNSPEAEKHFYHVRQYLGNQGLSGAADQLADQLNRFDFKGARKTFDNIARSLGRGTPRNTTFPDRI